MRRTWLGIALLALAGCGGGGGDAGESPTPTPRGWGQRDASYGTGGVATSVQMAGHFANKRFAFARDGSTYVLPNAYVVKLDAHGLAVPSFGVGGQAVLPARYSGANSPVVDGAGQVYVPMGLGAMKLRADGATAVEYGIQGVAQADAPGLGPWMNSLALDSQGALYAAGSEYAAKFDPQGRLDPSYAVSGMHILELGSGNVFDIQVDGQGNAYLAASTSESGAVVIKLNAAGFLATDFGVGGVWAAGCPGHASSISLYPNGHLAVGVNCNRETDPALAGAFLFKVDPQGKTVADYRAGGTRPLFGVSGANVQKVVALAGGEIFATGFRPRPNDMFSGCGSTAVVAKLDGRGDEVPAFNGNTVLFLDGEYATDMGADSGAVYVATTRRNSCADHPPAGSVAAVYKLSP